MSICEWCKRRGVKTTLKRDKSSTKGCYEEFRCRLICPKCHSRIPDFIIFGKYLIEIYRYNLIDIFDEFNTYPTFDGSNFSASCNNDLFEELIRSGWDINDENYGGVELFYEACMIDDISKVNLLLEFGLDIEKYGTDGTKFACSYGSLKTYKRLLQLGVELNIEHGLRAILHENLEMVKRLLSDGVDVNFKDKMNGSLIHAAAKIGSLKIFKYLLKIGADFNAITICSKTVYLSKFIKTIEIFV